MSDSNSKMRFADRVEAYVKYRPKYPDRLATRILEHFHLSKQLTVLDVGSGTGLSALPFLKTGHQVIGLEPNEAMRKAGDEYLSEYAEFTSASGSAEVTGMPDHSVDLILCGQAFHWFDQAAAKEEFARVCRGKAPVALSWNDRLTDFDAFSEEYEALIVKHATDYQQINHKNTQQDGFDFFFGKNQWSEIHLENRQVLDYDGLLGRIESSSYVPNAGSPENEAMRSDLIELFKKHQKNSRVEIIYDCVTYCGSLKP
jgi:SAM-dependent methyltransferase